jgi:hypothetical protein
VAPDGVTALMDSLEQAVSLLRALDAYEDHLRTAPPGFDPFSRDAIGDIDRVGMQWVDARAVGLREFQSAIHSARSSLATYLGTEAANAARFPGER